MKVFAKVLSVILGIFMVIGGIYCLFTPEKTYLMIGYAVGLSMVFDSIARFVIWWQLKKDGTADGWMLTTAILSAVFGFFILNSSILQLSIDAFIAYYIAIWLIIQGIIVIIRSWKVRKLHKNWNTKLVGTQWYVPLCLVILLCLFGVLCTLKPIIIASTIGIFIGLGMIFAGANLITLATLKVD